MIDPTTAGILAGIAAATATPCVRLDASRATEPAGPLATKLGGVFSPRPASPGRWTFSRVPCGRWPS